MRIAKTFYLYLSALLILAACQTAPATEVTPEVQASTANVVPSLSPLPQEPEAVTPESVANQEPEEVTPDGSTYPEPEETTPAGLTYPEPGALPPTGSAPGTYPQPGFETVPSPGVTQSPFPQAFGTPSPTSPGLILTSSPTELFGTQPFTGTFSTQALGTPGTNIPQTGVPGGSTAAVTPSATPTLGLMQTKLVATDPRTFQIASGEFQLVEFFAFWSPESQSMAPVMRVLEQRQEDRLRFVYLDIDDPANGLFKSLLNNRLPPVFFLLDGAGNVLHEWQGPVELEEFEAVFVEVIQ
jgi:thiol-disulfide isomerase/thioredoxin